MAARQSESHTDGEPLNKRRRIALACSACRVRKSRCDGRRPSCSTCKSLALECQYEPSESTTNVLVRKEYMSNLEQRLKDVEHALQRHDDLLRGHLSACTNTLDARSTTSPGNSSSSATRQLQDGLQLDTPNAEDPGIDEANTDGLAILFLDQQTPAFYGESSNIYFSRYLLQAMAVASKPKQHGPAAPNRGNSSLECNSPPFLEPPSKLAADGSRDAPFSPSTLPPGQEIDALLSTYFSSYGSMFPFVHESTFRQTYEEAKGSGFTGAHRTWLGLLNMTFAMANNIDQSAEVSAKARFKKSYVFFLRAAALCSEASTRTVSLDIVHYLLLAVLYLQGTQKSIQTWNMHGVLVRTAIALGLHSEKSSQGLDPIRQETRRRTWLTIYCLDKLQSVTFGRPPSIPDEYIVVQLPSPWITTPDVSTRQASEKDMSTEFLSATVTLYQIVGQSIATQYGMNLGLADHDIDESTTIQTATAMRQKLRRWASTLPARLSLYDPASEEPISESTDLNRLRVILTLRYHFVRILIHRPLLCITLRYLSSTPAGNIPPYRIQFATAEAHECIRSAESTIEIVHRVLGAQKTCQRNLGVWFFTLLYVFTSSLVLLSGSLLVQHGFYRENGTTDHSLDSILSHALDILDNLDGDNHLVHSCARFVRRLSERQGGPGHDAPEEHRDAQYPLSVRAGSDISSYEQHVPTFDLPSFPGLVEGDLAMSQFSATELFNRFFDESMLNPEQPGYSL